MPSYVAFLRAVNIGKRKVEMARLRQVLSQAGYDQVETYIQTGNVRVSSPRRSSSAVEAELEPVLADAFGFDIPTIVRSSKELAQLVAGAPRSPLGEEARHYLTLLKSEPDDSAGATLEAWDVPGERLALVGRDIHLWITKGYNEVEASNARLEKVTKQVATTRNWQVMTAAAARWT